MNKDFKHIAGLFFGIAVGLLIAYIFIPETSQRTGKVHKSGMELKTYNIKLGDKAYCTADNYDCEVIGEVKIP